MKNYITYDLINSPLRRCGGYGKANGCTDEQTAFGNYLYAIELLSGTYDHPDKIYAQGKIDMAKEVLEDIANACIDKENKKVNFDRFDFTNSYASRNLFMVSGLISYVIQYVALKQGLNFKYSNEESLNNCQMFDVKPVTDEEMISSVIITLNKNREETRKTNPNLANNRDYQPISLDKYLKSDKEL